MIDLRPVGYIIGLLVAVLGLTMLVPMAVDMARGDPNWQHFLEAAIITTLSGGLLSLASQNRLGAMITLQQSFVLTSGVWLALPAFGALPFIIGAPGVSFTDAYFEAMSGDDNDRHNRLPEAGGSPCGHEPVARDLAMARWPRDRHCRDDLLAGDAGRGMQFFRSEGFDTLGKILPRAMDISNAMIKLYVWLTVACAVAYVLLGMTVFDAVMHALTTMSTGGFSNHDASFGVYSGAPEYASSFFMLLASMPFIRYIQLAQGHVMPMWRDVQLRAYLRWTATPLR